MGELPAELRHELEHWFDGTDIVAPSLSYAVFDRSGVLFNHALGDARLDGHVPTLDTVYRIASMSKSFLAAAALVLVERGQLVLSDPVSRYLPEFVGPGDPIDPFCEPSAVTVRMLLDNSSGLPEDNGWADYELGLTRTDFVALVARGFGFTDLPGRSYQYSNVAFWMLGVIVERVSGQPFAEFAQDALLTPLGLTDTHYDASDYPDASRLALGFSTFDDGATWLPRPLVPTGIGGCAASMFSTPSDIARWSAWLSAAFVDGDAGGPADSILSRASRRTMQRAYTTMPALPDRATPAHIESVGYGYGLVIEHDRRFGVIAQHSGGLPGWSSNMRWHTDSGIGVVVFANTNGAKPSIPAEAMLRRVLESVDAPARTVTLWPATARAVEALDAAIVTFADGSRVVASATPTASLASVEASVPFSPNLLSDIPLSVRDSLLITSLSEIGGVAPGDALADAHYRVEAVVSAAELMWSIPGAAGTLYCHIELTPTVPSMLQRLTISTIEPDRASVATNTAARWPA